MKEQGWAFRALLEKSVSLKGREVREMREVWVKVTLLVGGWEAMSS